MLPERAPATGVEPRVCWVPPSVSSAGAEAIELAQLAGLYLDAWQEFALAESLNERPDGRWSAFEVGIVVPRQNGKGSILEARELAGLFLLDEQLLVHSAHQFDTSLEAFRRLLALIEDTPELDRRVARVSRSHGEEGIELKRNPRTGLRQRIRFRTRTGGGGRGFSGDLLVLDEAMILPEAAHGALLPTLSARPNPQVFYTATAVDQRVHEHGVVLARVRERGLRHDDPALMYMEWSANVEARLRELGGEVRRVGDTGPEDVDEEFARDRIVWESANPGLVAGRITSEHVEREQRSMDPRTFAVERLNVGDWPTVEEDGERVIPDGLWAALCDHESRLADPVCLAFAASPDRAKIAIGAAGVSTEGVGHLEIVEYRHGSAWFVDRMVQLVAKVRPTKVVCQNGSPAASLLPELEQEGIEVETFNSAATAQACGALLDAANKDAFRHLGTSELREAVRGARKRKAGQLWVWDIESPVDVSPLMAVTLASWAWATRTRRRRVNVEDYRIIQLVD